MLVIDNRVQSSTPHRRSFRAILIYLQRTTPMILLASPLIWFPSMEVSHMDRPILLSMYSLCTAGDLNTPNRSFDYNVESNLDLQYGMALVTGKQPVQLYQVGDHPIGETRGFLLSNKLNRL